MKDEYYRDIFRPKDEFYMSHNASKRGAERGMADVQGSIDRTASERAAYREKREKKVLKNLAK